MINLVVATGNLGKLQEIKAYLLALPCQLQLKPPELDIAETGITFSENARLKASQVALAMGQWAIADDSGLVVDALDGAPGIYSARYGRTDQERISRVLQELEGCSERGAQFVCAIALSHPDGTIALETEGICRGEILTAPRGDQGFGYDPIFYVPAQGQTFAEITAETKHKISHRGHAFAQLLPQLQELLPQVN